VAQSRHDIAAIIEALDRHYPAYHPIQTTDPFELVLWENVAYLAPPPRRAAAFRLLQQEIGCSPRAILDASQSALERVSAHGILKKAFACKLRTCAEIALHAFAGDLRSALIVPVGKAKRALRLFPGIGEPGAEKILLFSGIHAFLAPDSNALRVLSRLGFIEESKSYAQTYRAARDVEKAIGADFKKLRKAHELLQLHGQTQCKRAEPNCRACPVTAGCAYFRESAGAMAKAARRST